VNVHFLNLAHFRGFEQIDLTFEPDINVIAGANGVGKSGILHALATLFSRVLPEFTPSTAKQRSFTDEDVHYGKSSLEVSAIFTVADQQCHMVAQRVLGDSDKNGRWNQFWRRAQVEATAGKKLDFKALLATRTLTGDLEAGKAETERVLRVLKERQQQPLVIYFSPGRQLPDRPRSLPKPAPFEQKNAYPFALDERNVSLREFMHWFRWQELQASNGDKRSSRVLANLREAVTRFVPEFRRLRIETKPALRLVVEKNGTPLALNQLSDGERGLMAIIFDITRRLSIANLVSDDPLSHGEAIVMIDEIELHLHPKWQRQVLRRLRETFPRCQFIVTSHSPQVLGEVEARCVSFLNREEQKIIPWSPPYSLGLDANRILEEQMGVKVRNADIEKDLQGLFTMIDKDNLEAARQRIKEMQEKLGEDAPELIRARSLMDFLEGAE